MNYFKPGSLFLSLVIAIASIAAQETKPKPRIFITDSQSWEIAGGFAATKDEAAGQVLGGARPQTGEIIKTFTERCPDVIITMNAKKADYVVLMEHEGGKPGLRKDNKFALFNSDGDAIKAGSTITLGGAVKSSCEAILKDWKPEKASEAKGK